MTQESESELLGASIVPDADGLARLFGTYRADVLRRTLQKICGS